MLLVTRLQRVRAIFELCAEGENPYEYNDPASFGLAACFIAAMTALGWRAEIGAARYGDSRSYGRSVDRPEIKTANIWDQKAAAAYLDQRAGWWMGWQRAQRDHDTFCVSCHTAVPYAMSRPSLRAALAEHGPSANERKLLDNVAKRVRLWKEVAPFYTDADRGVYKSVESRGNGIRFECADPWPATMQAMLRRAVICATTREPRSKTCGPSNRPRVSKRVRGFG